MYSESLFEVEQFLFLWDQGVCPMLNHHPGGPDLNLGVPHLGD
jgi:hypothetical protein